MKVAVLLEHHQGDEMWTARVPLVDGCLAEGASQGAARLAIIPELQYFLKRDPALLQALKNPPELVLTTINLGIPENSSNG